MALFPSTRSQGTIATPKTAPVGLILAAIAGALLLWGVGVFLIAARRHAAVAAQAPVSPTPSQVAAPVSSSGLPPQMAQVPRESPEAPPPPPPPSPSRESPVNLAAASAMPSQAVAHPTQSLPQDACSVAMSGSGMKLPADFRVLAAGAYRGRDLDYNVGRNGHRASQIDVIVNSPGKPIALMLGAYDPVVWNVSWTSGTRVVAVYVGGYEPQQLAGLGSVPVLISSYEQHTPCPYFYLGGEGLSTVNPAAQRVFGKPVDMVYPVGKDGSVYVGAGGPPGGFSYERKLTPEPEPRNPLEGKAALDFAVQMGQLRLATAADGELWAKAMQVRRGGGALPPVFGQENAAAPPPPSGVYIVQSREFIFPDGLYGAHAVTFVVPPGVQRPRGNPGHSGVLEVR